MKTNEAPEKIYVHIKDKPCEITFSEVIEKECSNIEYIRADVFIEKVCVKLKKLMYDNLMFQGRLHREEIIENFVEEFRNYMKGE